MSAEELVAELVRRVEVLEERVASIERGGLPPEVLSRGLALEREHQRLAVAGREKLARMRERRER